MNFLGTLFIFFISLYCFGFADYKTTLGNLVNLEGVKKNGLTGYGLIVGLSGTGDSRNALTRKTINQYISHLGIHIEERQLNTRNVAVVAVTAELAGFYEKGDLIDVHVASIGDAKNIENGLLLQTALKAPNGEIYAVGAGIVGTLSGENGLASRGRIISGAVMEKSVRDERAFNFSTGLVLNLIHPSISLINEIKKSIENTFPQYSVKVRDYKKLSITSKNRASLEFTDVGKILELEIEVKPPAKIIIDRNTGMVVVANNVRIDSTFISLPGISIEVGDEENPQISSVIKNNTSIEELADQFNKLGLSPQKIVAIFSALKKSGAINADIITQ